MGLHRDLTAEVGSDSVWVCGQVDVQKKDFAVIAGGVVRLTGDIARELAGVVIGKFPIKRYIDAVKIIERKL